MTYFLLNLFGFGCFDFVELAKDLHVYSNLKLEVSHKVLLFKSPTPSLIAFTKDTNAHGPSPSQQHAGLHHAA